VAPSNDTYKILLNKNSKCFPFQALIPPKVSPPKVYTSPKILKMRTAYAAWEGDVLVLQKSLQKPTLSSTWVAPKTPVRWSGSSTYTAEK